MTPSTRFVISTALSLACSCASAATPDQPAPSLAGPTVQADSDGIVTNQAITVAGHEFFNYFIAAWRDKPDSDRYTLSIRERPSARLGSQVRIEFDRRPVYQARLPPSRAALKPLGEEAAEAAYQAVLADVQRVLVDDVDLARDEF
jgi:curli production assembly/transport component CsgE